MNFKRTITCENYMDESDRVMHLVHDVDIYKQHKKVTSTNNTKSN